jgi:hypothetical protein
MSAVLVHKAVEPGNLSVKGAKRLAEMLDNDEYIVQPKLDGVYCQVLFDPVFKAWIAYSRTGEHLHSVGPEILAQFSERNETERFIGELWLPNTPITATINGMARKKSCATVGAAPVRRVGWRSRGPAVHHGATTYLKTLQEWKPGYRGGQVHAP